MREVPHNRDNGTVKEMMFVRSSLVAKCHHNMSWLSCSSSQYVAALLDQASEGS